MSERSVRVRTLVGGLIAGGALAVTLPTGLAHAEGPTKSTTGNKSASEGSTKPTTGNKTAAEGPTKPTTGNKSADAVGRPDLGNPAPGVRAAQAIGDKVFNQNPGINKTLDDSPLGEAYHLNFGTGNYDDPTKGTNGVVKGELNVNAGKYYYDQTQKYADQYLGNKLLPDEKDLPGTLPKAIAGDGPTAKVSTAKPSNSNKAATCVAATACKH
ncbi:hypothetical protein [Mycobacterium sp. 48b]|uniref:hypothetical protein n=1 Tax=Mycobacterium sp. 48b TaxID=3400426 RepID=UPI003AAB43B6